MITHPARGLAAALLGFLAAAPAGEAAITSFVARGTGYYPANSWMEGGFNDRMGNPLRTLQAFLAGRASYVSVAMDSRVFPYGTKLRIAEFERRYGRVIEFRVVDTGGAFAGQWTSRIDICVADYSASLDPTVNGYLHCTVGMSGAASGGVTSTGANYVMYRVKVTADLLNIRTSPGTSAAKAGALAHGTVVDVYGFAAGGGLNWYKIWYGGAWRYIVAQYSVKVGLSVQVTSDLNVRTGPGTGYAKVGTLPTNSIIHCWASDNGWYKVWYNGSWRWIYSLYTKKA